MRNLLRPAFSLALITIILLTLNACTGSDSQTVNSDSTSVYNRVLKKGVLRVGYIPYPPALIKDPNTKKLSGIFHDVLQEVGRNLDLKIEFAEEVTWGTMIESVKTKRDDLICTAVYAKAARGKFVDFTLPLYYSPMKAYTYINNTRFDNDISRANTSDTRIATIDGEAVSIIAKTDFPSAKTVSLTQSSDVSQMLQEVAGKKADITFIEPVFANIFIKNNPGKIREVTGISPIRIYPVVMMVAKEDGKLLSMINIALEELHNNGFVEKTIAKYEPAPNSFYRVQKKYADK